MELSTVLASIAALLVVYYFFCKHDKIFEKFAIPYVSPVPLFGIIWPLVAGRKTVADVITDLYSLDPTAKYVGCFNMLSPNLVIRDLDLVKMIAVKSFDHFPNHRSFVNEEREPLFGNNLISLRDDRWRTVRSLLTPTFTSSKIRGMLKLMSDCAAEFSDYLAELPAEKRTMELKDVFARYANDTIASCAFGVSVNSTKDPNNEFYLMGREASSIGPVQSIKFFVGRALPTLSKLLGVRVLSERACAYLENSVTSMIRTRDEQNIYRPDMIQLMMETRDNRADGKALTEMEIIANVCSFFFGGLDSSTTLMCFAAHEIAVNPRVQERLREEIDERLAEAGGEVTYEVVNKIEYLDAVLNETLRMYPLAPALDRECAKEYELPATLPGSKPFTVPKGMNVWIPVYGFHHDPRYFEDPETFKPERFMGEMKASNQQAFMPFGIGPRMCIGNRFAMIETKVLMVHLLARCDLRPCAKTAVPMKLAKRSVNLTSANGFWVEIQPRGSPSRLRTGGAPEETAVQ